MRDEDFDTHALGSQSAGLYRLHRLLIWMSKDHMVAIEGVPFLEGASREDLAVFFHEYLHFLQNFSTTSGVLEFSIWMDLLATFSETFDATGTSVRPLSAPSQEVYDSLYGLLRVIVGERSPFASRRLLRSCKYKGAQRADVPVAIDGRNEVWPSTILNFEVETEAGVVSHHAIKAGTHILYESLASELEYLVAAGPTPDESVVLPSIFPYRVLELVAEAHGVQSGVIAVALGMLAINTADPWGTLLRLLAEFSNQKPEAEELGPFLRGAIERTAQEREALVEHLRDVVAPRLKAMFRRRGAVESGVHHALVIADELLAERCRNPLFELAPFMTGLVHDERLRALVMRHRPCDILQENGGAPDMIGRDLLTSLRNESTPPQVGLTFSQGTRTLDAQLANLTAHMLGGTILQTNDTEHKTERRCPFFTACDLSYRIQHEALCSSAPWKLLEIQGGENCWYTAGLLGTVGEVDVLAVRHPTDPDQD